MPTARKLPSGSWRCRVYAYTDADGKKHYESFTAPTKKKAELMAAQFAADKRTPVASMTVGQALTAYIDSREPVLSPATIRTYRAIARGRLLPIQPMQLDRLTQQDIQNAINAEVRAGLSPKSVRNIHGLLTATLAAYRPDFRFHAELPKKIRPELSLPTEDQISILLDAVRGTELELPVMLAAFGPMRRGEICALRAENIRGNIVHVCEAMVRTDDPGTPLKVKAPKSYAGDRFIEYPDFVARLWAGKSSGRVVDIPPDSLTNRFARTLRRVGIPRFRFHDLRHYSASIQHALGIPDVYIMQRGGWATDGTLKAIYRHAMEDRQREMNERANRHFSEMYDTKCDTKN